MPRLNRRSFLGSAGATLATPLLPTMTVAAAPASPTATQYRWARLYARAGNARTPAQIASALGIGPETATHLHKSLARDGVLHMATTRPGELAEPAGLRRHAQRPNARSTLDLDALMRCVTRNIRFEFPHLPRVA